MIWCHERGALKHTLVTVFSGPVQAVLAWIYIAIAGYSGGTPTIERGLLILWIVGAALNAILLPYSAWRMQLAAVPERHPITAAILSLVYAGGSVVSFWFAIWIIPLIFLVVMQFIFGF
jgi:hypothetical protein